MTKTTHCGWNAHDEFWWLPKHVALDEITFQVAYIEPFSDSPDSSLSEPIIANVSPDGALTGVVDGEAAWITADLVPNWWRLWDGENLHRSIEISIQGSRQLALRGPILLDFDCDETDDDYIRRLRQPRENTVNILTWVTNKFRLNESEIRCYFSGRKGFHLELAPQSVDAILTTGDPVKELKRQARQDQILTKESGGFDSAHPWKRLSNSINAWTQGARRRKMRRTLLSVEELTNSRIEEFFEMATVYSHPGSHQ